MAKADLRPCPFCGDVEHRLHADADELLVWCDNCGASAGPVENNWIAAEAFAAWNHRPIEDAEIEFLRRQCIEWMARAIRLQRVHASAEVVIDQLLAERAAWRDQLDRNASESEDRCAEQWRDELLIRAAGTIEPEVIEGLRETAAHYAGFSERARDRHLIALLDCELMAREVSE